MTQFNEKQAKAKGCSNTVDKMKAWLEDPPYKMTDEDLKLECFYSVMACAQALKGDELSKVLEGLDLKEATALNKYVLAGMHMLD